MKMRLCCEKKSKYMFPAYSRLCRFDSWQLWSWIYSTHIYINITSSVTSSLADEAYDVIYVHFVNRSLIVCLLYYIVVIIEEVCLRSVLVMYKPLLQNSKDILNTSLFTWWGTQECSQEWHCQNTSEVQNRTQGWALYVKLQADGKRSVLLYEVAE